MATGGEPTKMKTGDVVRLKSGGPAMCADWVDYGLARPMAHCRWFDARDKLHDAFFRVSILEPADPAGERPTAQDRPQARMAGSD